MSSNLPDGSDVSWAPWNEKNDIPKKNTCPFCGISFYTEDLIRIKICEREYFVCKDCNDDFHTCIKCGEKVMFTEDWYFTNKGQYAHKNC